MARVLHLFRCVVHRQPMAAAEEIEAVVNRGFAGCIHARPGGRRQVLLMDMETLEEFGLTPGVVKENITTQGIDLRALRIGERLRIGEALFEVTVSCEPCNRIEQLRPGLEEAMRGKRGTLCRVVEGGRVRTGDAIHKVEYAAVSR